MVAAFLLRVVEERPRVAPPRNDHPGAGGGPGSIQAHEAASRVPGARAALLRFLPRLACLVQYSIVVPDLNPAERSGRAPGVAGRTEFGHGPRTGSCRGSPDAEAPPLPVSRSAGPVVAVPLGHLVEEPPLGIGTPPPQDAARMAAPADFRTYVDQACRAAEEFSNIYYETMDKRRRALIRLYTDDAALVWNGNAVSGHDALGKFFEMLPTSEFQVTLFDCQPVHEQATQNQSTVLVVTCGSVKFEGNKQQYFNQNFLLTAQTTNNNTVWKIMSDCFRFQDWPS